MEMVALSQPHMVVIFILQLIQVKSNHIGSMSSEAFQNHRRTTTI